MCIPQHVTDLQTAFESFCVRLPRAAAAEKKDYFLTDSRNVCSPRIPNIYIRETFQTETKLKSCFPKFSISERYSRRC